MKLGANKFIVVAIFIATFMTSVEVTIVTTAMPTIISELHGLDLQSWVFSVYLLSTAVTTPIYGKLSDNIGRKKLFILGLLLFVIGSALCGFAPNMLMLVLFRLVQGLGAGAIMPLSFTIIADLFTFEERARVLAMNNTAWAISALVGPLLGGWIVDALNWHWVFFINVPFGLLTIALTAFGYKDLHEKSSKIIMDWKGIISLSVLLISLLLVFQSLSATQINWLLEGILILLFIASLLFFIHSEKSATDPIIDLSMFKIRTFSIQVIVALLLSGVLMGFNIYIPIWSQAIYRVPAFIAGLTLTPSSLTWMVASFFVGMLMRNFIAKHLFIFLMAIMIIFEFPLVFSDVKFPIELFYVITGVVGAIVGIIMTAVTLITQTLVPEENVGVASSTVVLGRTIGQVMMTGIFGLAFSLGISSGLTKAPQLNYNQVNEFISSNSSGQIAESIRPALDQIILGAVHNVFWIVIILSVITLAVNFFDKAQKFGK